MPHVPSVALALLALTCAPMTAQADWPSWRGVDHTGSAAAEASPPVAWSETDNIRWKTAIPGLGISSPVVLGGRVYLTTAIETEREAPPVAAEGHRLAMPPPTRVFEFAVLALDAASGEIAWRAVVCETVPHEGGHSTNSHASISPVTDGEHLFAGFGSRGVYCLDLAGEIVWRRELGQMETRRDYGEGSSPVVYGDALVVNMDHEGASRLYVLDKRTGEELWHRDREEVTSWSTPLVVEVDGRAQIVIAATGASRGYDLESGEVLWSLSGMTVNCIPTPPHKDGVVYLASGYRGEMLQAVRLSDARGELDHEAPAVLWWHRRSTPYVPSTLLHDDALYFLRKNSGVLSCVDAATGEVRYEGKKLGLRSVYASPVAAGGHVYVTSRDGVTKVLREGAAYEVVATNRVDDEVDASMAVVGDAIYLRGRRALYCIAADQR